MEVFWMGKTCFSKYYPRLLLVWPTLAHGEVIFEGVEMVFKGRLSRLMYSIDSCFHQNIFKAPHTLRFWTSFTRPRQNVPVMENIFCCE